MGSSFAHCEVRRAARSAGALIALGFLVALATPVLAQGAAPTDDQYLDWVKTQRSLVRAKLAMWDGLNWRANDLAGQAKHQLAKAGSDEKKATTAKAEIAYAGEMTAAAHRGSVMDAARLAVLDRLSQEATLREVHLAGANFLMVSQTIGDVAVLSAQGSAALTGDRVFRNGEAIETGRDSFAVLLLLDGSWLTLGPETTLRATTIATHVGNELMKGRLYRKLSCISNDTFRSCGSEFFVAGTALGTLGREYAVDLYPGSPAIVTALDGDMDLRTAAGPSLTLREGEWVALAPDGSASAPPAATNRNTVVRWWQDPPETVRK